MKSKGGGGRKRRTNNNEAWTAHDHEAAAAGKKKTERQLHRTALLSHDTVEKRSAKRLALLLTRSKKQAAQLKVQLQNWDSVEQRRLRDEQQARKMQEPKRKKGRLGPETWKLKGAARPAWQVYDFDERYKCPHAAAHEESKRKIQRTQNLLALYRGQWAQIPVKEPLAADDSREYMSLLMQTGHLALENKHYKTARESWLEVIELEGHVHIMTTAREDLMRLYLQLEKYEAAYKWGTQNLGLSTSSDHASTLISFSLAWLAIHLNKEESISMLVQAIQTNPLCAYYLAYHEIFVGVMEYTDQLEQLAKNDDDGNDGDAPQSSLEEAIEYCDSEQLEYWQRDDSYNVIRRLLQQTRQANSNAMEEKQVDITGTLKKEDVEWEERLSKMESHVESKQSKKRPSATDGVKHANDEVEAPIIDLGMYIQMFRTAMEMVTESGEL